MQTNQMFSQMNQAALARLMGRDPKTIARNAGICYEEETQLFHIPTMGFSVMLHYPDYAFTPELPGWHSLVILHYLDLADGFPPTGREIPFGAMRSGMVRGGGIDRKCEMVIQSMKDLNEDTMADICKNIGGEPISTNADGAWKIPFLPNFPVMLKLWLPDEEFPASGRLMVDESADHYLTIEDAVTVAEILLEQITGGAS
ncbi:MAG: DUF3786 domain-containing protein [Oscillospiraceae bacterium]|nr:DUF3786 domain-containing protein [Oscillospiraceae bacterium]